MKEQSRTDSNSLLARQGSIRTLESLENEEKQQKPAEESLISRNKQRNAKDRSKYKVEKSRKQRGGKTGDTWLSSASQDVTMHAGQLPSDLMWMAPTDESANSSLESHVGTEPKHSDFDISRDRERSSTRTTHLGHRDSRSNSSCYSSDPDISTRTVHMVSQNKYKKEKLVDEY